jgi:hypothetical protein
MLIDVMHFNDSALDRFSKCLSDSRRRGGLIGSSAIVSIASSLFPCTEAAALPVISDILFEKRSKEPKQHDRSITTKEGRFQFITAGRAGLKTI